jgi:TP901 family phage tail tape measure protein
MSSLKIDRLQLDIIINNDASRKRMLELEDSMKRMRAEMKKIPQESEKWKSMDVELKKLIAEHDQLISKIGLNGLTTKELSARMRELQMILKNMPDSPLRKEYAAQLQAIKARMAELNGQVKTTTFTFSKMADGFNRYFGMIAAFTASFAGIIFGARKAVDEFNKFDDKVADVMKTTGLAKNEVIELDKSLQKVDTRTAQDDLLSLARVAGKLGIQGKNDVDGFVKAADKIKVALSEDLGGNVEESINHIGKLTDIFKLTDQFGIEDAMLKVGSAINSLGASSTANEGYIVEFTKRMAGVAPSANISIASIMGLGATLDQFGQQSEMASTAVGTVITEMFKNPGEFARIAGVNVKDFTELLNTDANEAFIQFLNGLNGNNEGLGYMANRLDELGIEGKRSIAVLGVLANNTDVLRKQQSLANEEFEKGTSLTEEFNIKNNTAQAQREKSRKELALNTRELGERFAPIMAFSTNILSKFLKLLGAGIDFYSKNSKWINIIVVSLAAYWLALKLVVLEQMLANKTGIAGIAISKLKVLWDNAVRIGTLAAAAAQALFTGNLIRAKAAMLLLTKSMSVNPFVAIATVVVALGYAFYELSKGTSASTRAMQALADIQHQVNINIANEKFELGKLLSVAKDEKRSKEDREAAIKKLNELSPEYLGNIKLEEINTKKTTEAINLYLKSLEKKWKLELLEQELKENFKKGRDITKSSIEDNIKWYDALKNVLLTYGNYSAAQSMTEQDAFDRKRKAAEDQIEIIKLLGKEYADLFATEDPTLPTDTAEPKEGQEKEIDGVLHVYKNGKWVKKIIDKKPPVEDKEKDQRIKDLETYYNRLRELENELLQDQKKIIWEKYQDELAAVDKLLISDQQKNDMRVALQDKMTRDMQSIDDTYLSNQMALNDQEVADKLKTWAEIDKLYQESLEKNKKLDEEALKEKLERYQKELDAYIKMANSISKAWSSANSLMNKSDELKLKELQHNNDKSAKSIQELYDKGVISKEEYDQRMSALDIKFDDAQKEMQNASAKRAAELALFEQSIATAVAIANGIKLAMSTAKIHWSEAVAAAAIVVGEVVALMATAKDYQMAAPQYAEGNLLEIMGASDGKLYKAEYSPFSQNKIYSRPTLLGNKLVGEKGPELILNAPTTRNLLFNYPELANALRSVYVPQYASGNMIPKQDNKSPEYEAAIINMLVKLSKRLDEPIHADVSWMDIKKKSDQYNKITKTSSGN